MKKILMIEDDQIVANTYHSKLAVKGLTVETVTTAEAGLERLKTFSPDVLVLDLILPGMSGLELLKQLRATPQYQKLPIIIFSNTYLSSLVQSAWKAGATKCLSKANCSPQDVIESIRTTLGLDVDLAKATLPEPKPKLASAAKPAKSESIFVKEMRNSFTQSFPETLAKLRHAITALAKSPPPAKRAEHTQEIYYHLHALMGVTHLADLGTFARLIEALEALVMELHEKPETITVSTLRTLAAAIDFLPVLYEQPGAEKANAVARAKILVVDDEPISRRAVTHALESAKLKSVGVDDPKAALQLLSDTAYDLVFLDVNMPEMNGHELCARLRALPRHKKTPVIFVTGLNDFQNRANSTMSGGNDFIAKPFPFLELAVKSLVHLLRAKHSPALTPAG